MATIHTSQAHQSSPLVILPLKYTYFTKPLVGGSRNILYESGSNLWRDRSSEKLSNHQNLINGILSHGGSIIDNVEPLRAAIDELNSSSLGLEVQLTSPLTQDHLMNVVIQGPNNLVMDARHAILKRYNQTILKEIPLNSKLVNGKTIQPELRQILDEISRYNRVEILATNFQDSFNPFIGSTSSNTHQHFIYVLGNQDNVTAAESRVRVAMDDLMGLSVDYLSVEICALPLLGGPNFINFKNIAKETGANIHLPDILPELFNSNIISKTSGANILITGLPHQVISAKKSLANLMDNVKFYAKNCVIKRVKLDLLSLTNQREVINIMFKKGAYIQLPSIGDPSCIVTVQSVSVNCVEATLDEFLLKITEFHTLNYEINHISQVDNLEVMSYLIEHSSTKSSIITYVNNKFEIAGTAHDIKDYLSILESLPCYPLSSKDISLNVQFELSNEQKDFIGGKKNGKLMKIMNQTNVTIKYQAFNEYNFLINILGSGFNQILTALKLISDELPSEYSFNIPEAFHKQVIGSGGQTIQSIMRKYNVFIKFSNTYDILPPSHSFHRYDNVVIRCPRKNSKNIPLVEKELLDLVAACSTSYYGCTFKLLRSHYRLLVEQNRSKNFISDIEKTHSSCVDFPIDSPQSDISFVQIKSHDGQFSKAASSLKGFLPENYEFRIATSNEAREVINHSNDKFIESIIVPFRVLFGIEVLVIQLEAENSTRILLSYPEEKSSELQRAITELTSYLRDKDILIIEKSVYQFEPVIEESIIAPPPSAANSPQKATYQSRQLQLPPPLFNIPYNNTTRLNNIPQFNAGHLAVVPLNPGLVYGSYSPKKYDSKSPTKYPKNNYKMQLSNPPLVPLSNNQLNLNANFNFSYSSGN